MRSIQWMILALILGFSLARPALAERDSPDVAEQFELGQRFLKRGYYVKAMEQFNRIRNYHRDDPYAVKAELAIADLYFAKGEWDQARLSYMDFQRSHPRHEELDYVVYRIGLSVYKKAPKIAARDQVWTRQTVNQWTGFATRFPESEYLEEVTEKLTECQERLARKELVIAEFYLRREAWKSVRGRVEGMLHSWPQSEYAPEALELLAMAQAWQGEPENAARTLQRLAELDPKRAESLGSSLDEISAEVAEEPSQR